MRAFVAYFVRIGLGIRLARTHFNVDVELRKAAELRRAASVSEAPVG